MTVFRASPSGRRVDVPSDTAFDIALALGQFAPDLRTLVLIGRNPDLGAVEEDVWEGGGLYSFQASAVPLEIVSTSANDTAAGTGARTFRVIGLDANGDEKTVDVTLSGLTPVLVGTFLRVNGGFVLTSGSTGSNVGTVTTRTVSGATPQLVIGAGRGFQAQFIYTVPRGFTAIVGTFFFSTEQASGGVGQTNATILNALSRARGSNTWLRLAGFSANESNATTELSPWPPASLLPELTDFRFSGQCLTANMRVNVGMTLTLAKNDVSFG